MRSCHGPLGSRVAAACAALAALPGALLVSGVGFADELARCHKVRPGDTRPSLALHKVFRAKVSTIGGRNARPLSARAGDLERESRAAVLDDLSRMGDLATVARFRKARLLVPIAARTDTYYVADVAAPLRVVRPWTKRFIEQLAAALHGLSGRPLRITSLTRTIARQAALRRMNVNAAPARGRVWSTHLTGASVDISKRGLSTREVDWLRTVLAQLRAERLVHAIEEFREPHFHVMVRRSYARYAATLRSPLLIGTCRGAR